MDTHEFFKILLKRCGKKFIGVFAKDTLPNKLPPHRPLLLICNTDPKTRPGRHWVAMYFDTNGKSEYFDSFGQYPIPCFDNDIVQSSIITKTSIDSNHNASI